MKKLDLTNDQTRLDVIEAIVLKSSHFTCGNVTYRRTSARIVIFEADNENKMGNPSTFHSTGILTELGAFTTWMQYNALSDKVELVVG
jgi:hypothetical protein